MTGPEHYRMAESHIVRADDARADDDEISATIDLQFAQVHATLALAAATAQNIRRNDTVAEVAADTWSEVLQ